MSKTKAKEFAVTLLRDHRHGGTDYPAGTTINVPEHTKNWLSANRVIAPDAAPQTTAPAAD